MFDALRRPLSLRLFLAIAFGATAAVALYCLAYTWLVGRPETLGQSFGWAVANVLPWLIAIELGKRAPDAVRAIAVLVAALAASLILGYLTGASDGPPAFEMIRRLPSLAITAALVALLRSSFGQARRPAEDMRLLPRQIEWVRAAGNYVELRAGGRTIVQRGSIGSVERDLEAHGFVRIHRSMLVRRDRIARIRREDVILHDGTHLPVGKRYRSALAA